MCCGSELSFLNVLLWHLLEEAFKIRHNLTLAPQYILVVNLELSFSFSDRVSSGSG